MIVEEDGAYFLLTPTACAGGGEEEDELELVDGAEHSQKDLRCTTSSALETRAAAWACARLLDSPDDPRTVSEHAIRS